MLLLLLLLFKPVEVGVVCGDGRGAAGVIVCHCRIAVTIIMTIIFGRLNCRRPPAPIWCIIVWDIRARSSPSMFCVIGELSEFWRFFQVKINESQTRERMSIVEILNS